MRKLFSLLIAGILIFSLFTTGCSSQKNSQEESQKTIKFATYYSDKQQGAVYQEIIDGFEKTNKDIKVELTQNFGDEEKIKEALSQKGSFDIIGLKRNQVIEFAKSGLLSDISSFVDENGLNQKLYKISLAYGKYNGKIYGIGDMPMSMEWFYNYDMFQRLKLKEPTNLKELIDTCKKLKANGIAPIGIGGLDGFTLSTFFGMITSQTSGTNELTSKYGTDYSSYKNVSGMNNAFSIYGKLAGSYIPQNSAEINYRQSVDDFVNGKIGMLPAGSWAATLIDQIKPAGFNYRVFDAGVAMVQLPVSQYSATAGQVIALPSGSKNMNETKKFLEYLFSEEAQKVFVNKGYTSSLISVNTGVNSVKKQILNHLEATDDNSIMLIDNLEPTMSESLTMVLRDVLEGRVKVSEAWNRVLRFTFQK